MLDSLADLSLSADPRVEDCSQQVLEDVCAPLGPLPTPMALGDRFSIELPAKDRSNVRQFSRLRRLLKAVAGHQFNSLSQVHSLNVMLCKALTQIIVHGSKFPRPSPVLDATDDRPLLEFERRAMKMEMDICRYLTELITLSIRAVLGEAVDFGTLATFAEPIPAVLSFDPTNPASQESVFERLLEVLAIIPISFEFAPELQRQLREICGEEIAAQGPMTMIGLAAATQFLSEWFDLFPGDARLLPRFAQSLWLWCGLVATVPGGNGMVFLADHIRARFRALVDASNNYRLHFKRVSRVLQEAAAIVGLLSTVERCSRVPEKYAALSADINRVVTALAETPLKGVGPIIATVFRCSYLRLRLYVSLPELQNFAVCCHNLLYLEPLEAEKGLNSLLPSILHTFPNSPEMRGQLRILIRNLNGTKKC
jgi:hypothetical protein